MSKNEITAVQNVDGIPVIKPEMDKKELFNLIQDTNPIADLVDKEFKLIGIIPEKVEVPKTVDDAEVLDEDGEVVMVERTMLTLLTDVGTYTSYSNTFMRALKKAIIIFEEDLLENTYVIKSKQKNKKVYYNVTAL